MTRTDTTGEKPVAPIRRAKIGTVAAKPAQGSESRRETDHVQTAPPAPEQADTRDAYRSAGRIWPD